MECCGTPMCDWSYHPDRSILDARVAHFYCVKCNGHFHKGTRCTKEEWFFYINEITYTQYLE